MPPLPDDSISGSSSDSSAESQPAGSSAEAAAQPDGVQLDPVAAAAAEPGKGDNARSEGHDGASSMLSGAPEAAAGIPAATTQQHSKSVTGAGKRKSKGGSEGGAKRQRTGTMVHKWHTVAKQFEEEEVRLVFALAACEKKASMSSAHPCPPCRACRPVTKS